MSALQAIACLADAPPNSRVAASHFSRLRSIAAHGLQPVNNVNTVHVSARMPAELAEQIRRLAEGGDRTDSRDIGRALGRHVAVELPAERDETSNLVGQSSSSQPAGPNRPHE
jgi:hypothetical protein